MIRQMLVISMLAVVPAPSTAQRAMPQGTYPKTNPTCTWKYKKVGDGFNVCRIPKDQSAGSPDVEVLICRSGQMVSLGRTDRRNVKCTGGVTD